MYMPVSTEIAQQLVAFVVNTYCRVIIRCHPVALFVVKKECFDMRRYFLWNFLIWFLRKCQSEESVAALQPNIALLVSNPVGEIGKGSDG